MKLLALDTSSTACSIALLIDDKVSALHRILPLQQAQSVLPMLQELLSINHISLKEFDAISFGCGPGSFTGVRIAASVAQGLSYALRCPVIPVSSLAALAQAAYEDLQWKKLLVGVDARIQEIYWGAYIVNEQGLVTLIDKETACPPEKLSILQEQGWYGVGNAWEIYKEQIQYKPFEIDTTRLPTASGILKLAAIKYAKQEWVTSEEALPVYLRAPV